MNLIDFLASSKELKAAFYGRFSTDGQKIDTQRQICQAYADKHGITIVKEYIDENISAFKKSLDKRTNLDELRKDAKNGCFDCVLVYKGDRLARKIDQHIKLWAEFRELGIPIIMTESNKLYTSENPTDIVIEFGLSAFEAENTKIRTRDYYNSNTEKGVWLGGKLPYGYRYEDAEDGDRKDIVQVSDEIDKVKKVFEFYKRGYGFKRTASLMEKKFPKADGVRGKWVAATVKSIVTNPFYAGYTTSQRIVHGAGNSVRDRSEWILGLCEKIPAAISTDEWGKCMGIYEKKKNGEMHRNKYITPYFFADVIYCKDCDVKLLGKNYSSGKKRKDGTSYGGRVYRCPICKKKWDADKVNDYLIDDFLSGWTYQFYTNNKDELHEKVMEKIKSDIADIDMQIKQYKKELSSYNDKLDGVEEKQRKLGLINVESDELQLALIQYRISTQKKISVIKDSITLKEKEKQQLQLTYGDSAYFEKFIKEITSFEYDFNEPDFRKLVLYLMNKVKISNRNDNEYLYDMKAIVDLNERGHIDFGF